MENNDVRLDTVLFMIQLYQNSFIYDTLSWIFFVKMYTKDFADIRTPEKSLINTTIFKIMS